MTDFQMLNELIDTYSPDDIYHPLNYSDSSELSDLYRQLESIEHDCCSSDIDVLLRKIDDLANMERCRRLKLRYLAAKKKQKSDRLAACAAARYGTT